MDGARRRGCRTGTCRLESHQSDAILQVRAVVPIPLAGDAHSLFKPQMGFVGIHQVHTDIERVAGHGSGGKTLAPSLPYNARRNPPGRRVSTERFSDGERKAEFRLDVSSQEPRCVLGPEALFLFTPGELRVQEIEAVFPDEKVRSAEE